MEIRAAVARATRTPLSLESLELDPPRDDEILVRVVATGICHTDVAMRDQVFPVPQPVVLGHEGAGIVEAVGGAITKVTVGDHVVMTFNSCGRCAECLDKASAYCTQSRSLNFAAERPDGTSPLHSGDEMVHGNFFGQSSFATHAICNERNAIKVEKSADLAALGPLACGVQTGAGAIINSLKVGPGASLAVFGAGAVGLSAIMAGRLVGASEIVAIDMAPGRLDLARELGATDTILASDGDVPERIRAIVPGGVKFAFEATGLPAVADQAVASLGMRGVCGLVGSFPPDATMALNLLGMLVGGRTLRGIVEGDSNPDVFIPQLIDLNRRGRFPYDRLIRYYDFADINEAIHDIEAGRVIKPVLRMAHSDA